MLYAVLAVSSIARGRVTSLDVAAAKAHPGVVEVMTPANTPQLAQDPDAKPHPFMFRLDLLQNDRVRYANQPIAVVIAETLEAATEGAALLSPRYETEPARVGLDVGRELRAAGGRRRQSGRGAATATSRPAWRRHRSASRRPTRRRRNTTTRWSRTRSSRRGTATRCRSIRRARAWPWRRARIAGLFGIAPENIHIRSPFLGGGFGSKGLIAGPQVLGIMAARLVGRPVKLVLRREQMFGPVGPSRADAADAAPGRRRRAAR